MTGLAFEGEGPHKAADYFARSPLSLTSTMADFKNYSGIVTFSLGTIQILRNQEEWVGGVGQMIMQSK